MQKKLRTYSLVILDAILINISFVLSLLIRFEFEIPLQYAQLYIYHIGAYMAIKLLIFAYFKLYSSLWQYASIEELVKVVIATVVSNSLVLGYYFIRQIIFPKSIYILLIILDMALIGGSRFGYRAVRRLLNRSIHNKNSKRVMIIGAGYAGVMVIKEMKTHKGSDSIPVVLIDDDRTKQGKIINGVPVLGPREDIQDLALSKNIDEIIIAIPSASKREIKAIIEKCKETKCKIRTLPGIFEIIDGKVDISHLRDVQIEDLLGREEIKLNNEEIVGYIKNKKILVTGGGGSIGSELCRQIAKYDPKELVILDIYENNAYDLQNELLRSYKELNLKIVIASVRDRQRIEEIVRDMAPDVIFHAAAHKHVPLMEDNPKEAIKNNVIGTLNLVQAADKYSVRKFVLISTDKAVNPTNIMGASKRLCEMIVQSIDKVSKTEFVGVRFGNVLGSNGSVIPLFKNQISEGGPITVTHPDIIRYFMTIPEASQLVIQAGAMAKGGEIFVLDMGEPVRIIDLAEDLIRLSGYELEDIQIEITGLRPGEKLFEELLLDDEGVLATKHEKIFIGKPLYTDYKLLLKNIENLKSIIHNGTKEDIKTAVRGIVATYKDPESVNSSYNQVREFSKEAKADA